VIGGVGEEAEVGDSVGEKELVRVAVALPVCVFVVV